jgi:outer membrane protein assembly factor BamB
VKGSVAWTFTTQASIQASPSVGEDGTIYIGSDDGHLYAIDPSGHSKWAFAAGDQINSSAAVANGVVYFGSRDNKVYAVNASTGAKIWDFTTGGEVYSSPAIGSFVYVGSDDGNFYALDIASGVQKWVVHTGGPVRSPALPPTSGCYFTTLAHEVYRVDEVTGAQTWRFVTGGDGGTYASPAIGSDGATIYVPSTDGLLYAIDANTGTASWTFDSGGSVLHATSASPLYWGSKRDRVFFANDNGFFAVDAMTHQAVWSNNTWVNFGYMTSPAVAPHSALYLGSFVNQNDSNAFLAIDSETGNTLWSGQYSSGLYSDPSVSPDGSTVYVGSFDGKLYAIQ